MAMKHDEETGTWTASIKAKSVRELAGKMSELITHILNDLLVD